MKRLLVAVTLAATCVAGAGCIRGMRGGIYIPVAPVVATAANIAVTAAIVGTAVALAAHDAHMHWENCGCQRQWHEGRWVYWYGGWWEYHDPNTGYWYHY